MTLDEIRKYSGVPVVLYLREETVACLLQDMQGYEYEVIVQSNKEEVENEDDAIVILMGIVQDGETVILLVSDKVTEERIDLYFNENREDGLKPNLGWLNNQLPNLDKNS